jgi:hypothetical protein
MRAGGKGDIQPIVDEEAGGGAADRFDAAARQREQRTAVEIALAQLHEMDAGARRHGHTRHHGR